MRGGSLVLVALFRLLDVSNFLPGAVDTGMRAFLHFEPLL